MAAVERFGFDATTQRSLFRLAVGTVAELPPAVSLATPHFVALIAWDARRASAADIATVARTLLDSGCVYFCCWGPDCERVHDVIDQQSARGSAAAPDASATIITTWHADESLEEAAWFCLWLALPDEPFLRDATSVLAVSIGDAALATRLAAALEDPRRLASRAPGEDIDAK